MINELKNCLIFGATGSIGNYLFNKFSNENINVIGTTTNKDKLNSNTIYVTNDYLNNLQTIPDINMIIWAHGSNCSDNITTFNCDTFDKMIDANVKFILNTLNYLLINNKILKNSKMVIVSSIWQDLTKENKLSYSITKSSLNCLVKNIAYDLSSLNSLINNVLPGVIDNEMTHQNLSETQINFVKNYTHFNRLINLDDIYNTIKFLVIENTGITGQSIKVDLGFTNIKKI